MPPQVHRMISKDLTTDTGVCRHCGPVALAWKHRGKGKPAQPRCAVGVKAQRDAYNALTGPRFPAYSHGMNSAEAAEFRKGKCCRICGTTERLHVDHCHATERLRGVLCQDHNFGLGYFHDSIAELETAIAYLRETAA